MCSYEHEKSISPNHLKSHGLTFAEYKKLFPLAKVREQSEQTKNKISNAKIGKSVAKGKIFSDQHRQNISNAIKIGYKNKSITHWNSGRTTTIEVKEKIAAGNRAAINIGNIKQREAKHIRMKEAAASFSCEILNINEDRGIATAQCLVCAHVFSFTHQIFYPNRLLNTQKLCPVCQPRETFSSKSEREVSSFIKSIYAGNVIDNDREILGGKEIDILIPALQLGFEFTGLYWHAENQNPEKNHLLWKQQFAAKNGIQIITIFEDEWLNKQEIVMSRISGMLGKHHTIFARKCNIQQVDAKSKNDFLLKNHIQGRDTSSIATGLYYQDELVAIATFKKTNMIKGGDGKRWELSRFCSKLNIRVVGGASKLIKHFMNTLNTEQLDLISYADCRWSTGHLYKSIGFDYGGTSTPGYWYIVNCYKKRVHRSAYMKHLLVKTEDDKKLTGRELAQRAGLDRIWDCGTTKWILKSVIS